ncbi:MAG: response regulator [Candidatus Omnitrophica bacterium]|nr:response regulator [Candidatus Omnitrophota bacterium]
MPHTILVVEDEPDLREVIVDCLKGAGYTAVSCGDGNQVLGLIRQHAPSLVILDLQLPGMNGWKLCHLIKSNPATARLLIVALSGLIEEDSGAGDTDRFDYMIAKPFDPDALLNRLRKLLKD